MKKKGFKDLIFFTISKMAAKNVKRSRKPKNNFSWTSQIIADFLDTKSFFPFFDLYKIQNGRRSVKRSRKHTKIFFLNISNYCRFFWYKIIFAIFRLKSKMAADPIIRPTPISIGFIHVKFGFDKYNGTQVIASARRISGCRCRSGSGDRGENIVSPPDSFGGYNY